MMVCQLVTPRGRPTRFFTTVAGTTGPAGVVGLPSAAWPMVSAVGVVLR